MGAAATTPERLPRGRHGLSRDEVVESQRGRMLRAIAEAMAEKGYAETSVADVLRAAGVSRETFYEQFESKQDCFMAAYDAAVELLVAGLANDFAGGGSASDPLDRLDAALGGYIDALAAEPAFARVFLVEVYAAGPEALKRRAEGQRRFVEVLCQAVGAEEADARFEVEAFVAATSSMVTARIGAGDVEGLRALRAPLTQLARRVLTRER